MHSLQLNCGKDTTLEDLLCLQGVHALQDVSLAMLDTEGGLLWG